MTCPFSLFAWSHEQPVLQSRSVFAVSVGSGSWCKSWDNNFFSNLYTSQSMQQVLILLILFNLDLSILRRKRKRSITDFCFMYFLKTFLGWSRSRVQVSAFTPRLYYKKAGYKRDPTGSVSGSATLFKTIFNDKMHS